MGLIREGLSVIFLHINLVRRLVLFCICVAVVVVLCYIHGFSAKTNTVQQISQMIASGKLTGKAWRVINIQDSQITLTRFHHTIKLASSVQRKIQIDDKISFIAKARNSKDGIKKWCPVRMKIHGTSALKYILSFFSVAIISIMLFRYFDLDRDSFSVVLKKEENHA